MLSLLVLSMVLSAPLATAQAAAIPGTGLPVEPAPLVRVHHGLPQQMLEELQWKKSFDAIEVTPDADICYKIRAYIFSNGPDPELLRETTCGPKRPTAKSVGGAKPKLVPIDAQAESAGTTSPR